MPIEAPAPAVTGNGPALIQFVDSISATATVRLDVNDGIIWFCQNFSAPPPRLRRSVSQNAMRDGEHVSSSAYEARGVELSLALIDETSEEFAAQSMQALWRELDRPTNILRYQSAGMSKPVFFILQRSDVEDLEELWTTPIARKITISLPAEPFALGLKETLGPFTVSNDPFAATNPCYVDLPTIVGDVPADVAYWDDASGGLSYMSRLIACHSGPPAVVAGVTTAWQLDSPSSGNGADTTNPGGAADPAMSGTESTNFLRTTFATSANMVWRVQRSSVTQPGGMYRVLVAVRRSGTTSTLKVRGSTALAVTYIPGREVTLQSTTNRQIVDLGVFAWPEATPVGSASVNGSCVTSFRVEASRTGGTDTLDWDVLQFIPAGGQNGESLVTTALVDSSESTSSTGRVVLDGANDQAFKTSTVANPTTTAVQHLPVNLSGGFPLVSPGAANRLYVVSWWRGGATAAVAGVTTTTAVNLAYWPRYLFVRPSAS